jgi:hypothetical protein
VRVLRSRHGADKWSTFMTVRTRASGWMPSWVTRGYPSPPYAAGASSTRTHGDLSQT